MQDVFSQVEEIVENITNLEKSKLTISEILRKLNEEVAVGPNQEIKDEKLISAVEEKNANNFSITGIDGGIVKDSFHGLELVLLRAVAVNFVYNNGSLKKVDYYPSSIPMPLPKTSFNSFSEFELSSWYNFERQIVEITTAIESIENMKTEFLFLDGSVIPQYVTKPSNPVLKERYHLLIRKYKELFEISNEKLILAGIVEDSRSVKFCDILTRRILSDDIAREVKIVLEKTNDSNLLYHLLKRGERTFVFNYSQHPEAHPLLKEFEEMKGNFYSFYIKTADFDRPLRVDFVGEREQTNVANKISEILMRTCGHSQYGLPSVLIEADQRAKLAQRDLDLFYLDLISRIGNVSTLFKMRREMRPF